MSPLELILSKIPEKASARRLRRRAGKAVSARGQKFPPLKPLHFLPARRKIFYELWTIAIAFSYFGSIIKLYEESKDRVNFCYYSIYSHNRVPDGFFGLCVGSRIF